MAKMHAPSKVRVGPQGRVVIPASLRKALGIRPGQMLVARAEEGRVVLEQPDAIIARLKNRLRAVPSDVSLVDELISERRKESYRERRR